MFGFIGRIFGTEKAIARTIDAVAKGIDKLVYTDEEKAGDAAKDRSNARKAVVGWMNATQGQNLSRRFIALLVVSIWALMYLSGLGLSVASVWVEDQDKLLKSSQVIQSYGEDISGAVMLILSFYFAAPYMGSIVDGALNRFGKKK